MNRDKEIYGIANTYIREHGEDAIIVAAMRADALLEAGDLGGQACLAAGDRGNTGAE